MILRIISLIFIFFIFGCSSISKSIVQPYEPIYNIKLRIVIDNINKKACVSYDEIEQQISAFNDLMCDSNIHADIYKIEFVQLNLPPTIIVDDLHSILDSESNTNNEYINVYYLNPTHVYFKYNFETFIAGMGTLPNSNSHYMFVVPYFADKYVFAHELCHVALGLYHTFDADDWCDDTPPQNGPDINNNNIMDYGNTYPKIITKDQLKRAKTILNNERRWYTIIF